MAADKLMIERLAGEIRSAMQLCNPATPWFTALDQLVELAIAAQKSIEVDQLTDSEIEQLVYEEDPKFDDWHEGLGMDRIIAVVRKATGITAPDHEDCPKDLAPPTGLPNWDECQAELDNPPEHTNVSALHQFIYDYDDADQVRSSWFMHQLELVLFENSKQVLEEVIPFVEVELVKLEQLGGAVECEVVPAIRSVLQSPCKVNQFSWPACDRGTRGCIQQHYAADILQQLKEAARWLHAVYDRPPQTPEAVKMLFRIDSTISSHGGKKEQQ